MTNKLTLRRTALLEKLIGPQVVKKFPTFMEPEGSLPRLQKSTTCSYPEHGKFLG
jgi:hypothetical protein